jgi:hypothetical protein
MSLFYLVSRAMIKDIIDILLLLELIDYVVFGLQDFKISLKPNFIQNQGLEQNFSKKVGMLV